MDRPASASQLRTPSIAELSRRRPGSTADSRLESVSSSNALREASGMPRLRSIPKHLVPLCIDTSTGHQYHFRFVLDIVHLINCMSLRYYVKPSREDFYMEKGETNHLLSTSDRSDAAHVGHNLIRMADVLGHSSFRDATGFVFDERTMLRGEICLIGAVFHLPDEHNSYNVGVYTLDVPNHRFFLKPSENEQNQLLLASLPRWIRAANTPYYDSPIAFVCVKIRTKDGEGWKEQTAEQQQEQQEGDETQQDSSSSPSPQSGGVEFSRSKNLLGLEVAVFPTVAPRSVYEAERDATNIEKGNIEHESLPRPRSTHYFPLGMKVVSAVAHNVKKDDAPAVQQQDQYTSRHQCVIVVPFELASSTGIRISVDHALVGMLSPQLQEPLRLSTLFGRHKDEARACTIPLIAPRGTKCRAMLSVWWVPPTHSFVSLRLAASNLFRSHFAFGDPFLRLRLKSENRAATAAASLHGGQKKMVSEFLYRSEAYYNCYSPSFMPIAIALPPVFESDATSTTSATNLASSPESQTPRRPLALFSIVKRGTDQNADTPLHAHRPSLSDFLGPSPRKQQQRPSTAQVRPKAAADSKVSSFVPYRSPIFPEKALPRVAVPQNSPLLALSESSSAEQRSGRGGLYFGVTTPFPVVLLNDRIVCDVFDAFFEESTKKAQPAAVGSFSFTLEQLLRSAAQRHEADEADGRKLCSSSSSAAIGHHHRQPSSSHHSILTAHIHRGYSYIPPLEEDITAGHFKTFVPGGMGSGRSHVTNIKNLTHMAHSSAVHVQDATIDERLTFQHFLSAEWELNSVIVVDMLGGALPLHRAERFANGWNVFHGLIVAINAMSVPLMSRASSDIYGCGSSYSERFTVFPIHQCAEIFNQQVDELANIHTVSFKAGTRMRGEEVGATAAQQERQPSGELAKQTQQQHQYAGRLPFSLVKDWTGESALPYYEAKRAALTRSDIAICTVPFQLCQVVRRMLSRCEATQRARIQGLASSGSKWSDLGVGSKLIHVVTVVVGSGEFSDAKEAVEVLQLASTKPIIFLMVLVGWVGSLPDVFTTLPNVIVVDFKLGGYLQLHHSFHALRAAFDAIPAFFLNWARLNMVQPGMRRNQSPCEDADVATSDCEDDAAIHPSRKSPTRPSIPRERFAKSSERFAKAFGFTKNTTRLSSSTLASAAVHSDGASPPREDAGEFTKPETIVFSDDNVPRDSSQVTLRNATMTIVDLYMSNKQLAKKMRQEAVNLEVDRRYDSAVSNLLTRKHMQLLRQRQALAESRGVRLCADDDDDVTSSSEGGAKDANATKFEILEERRDTQNRGLWSVLPKPPKGDGIDRESAMNTVNPSVNGGQDAPRTITTAGIHRTAEEPGKFSQLASLALGPRGKAPHLPEPPKFTQTRRFAHYSSAATRKMAARVAEKWRTETRRAFDRYSHCKSRAQKSSESLDWGVEVPPNTLTPMKREKLKIMLSKRPQSLSLEVKPRILTRAEEEQCRARYAELLERARRDTEMFELRDQFARGGGDILDEWMGLSIVPQHESTVDAPLPSTALRDSPALSRSDEASEDV